LNHPSTTDDRGALVHIIISLPVRLALVNVVVSLPISLAFVDVVVSLPIGLAFVNVIVSLPIGLAFVNVIVSLPIGLAFVDIEVGLPVGLGNWRGLGRSEMCNRVEEQVLTTGAPIARPLRSSMTAELTTETLMVGKRCRVDVDQKEQAVFFEAVPTSAQGQTSTNSKPGPHV
jgi:hypothetical protein